MRKEITPRKYGRQIDHGLHIHDVLNTRKANYDRGGFTI